MIIYLHGFSSASGSSKANRFKKLLKVTSFHIPDYPAHRPREATSYLKDYVTKIRKSRKPEKILLMGSSLGGFYAQYLGAMLEGICGIVLINPALQPELTLKPYIGQHNNMVTGEPFEFSQDHFNELNDYHVAPAAIRSRILVLLDKGDEIIDYRVARDRFQGIGKVVCYEGGDHWFRHIEQAVPEILEFSKQNC